MISASDLLWTGTGLAAMAMILGAACWAWSRWLGWKQFEPSRREQDGAADLPSGARIEMAALKERLRKLEAIAQGVDL